MISYYRNLQRAQDQQQQETHLFPTEEEQGAIPWDEVYLQNPSSSFPPHLPLPYPQQEEGEAVIWTWTWLRTFLVLTLGPIVLFTIIGNSIIVYAFLTKRGELRAPTHYFIANLALADGLVGLLAMPFLATLQITGRWYFGQTFCYAWVIIHFWLCSASILSTLAVCLERYIGVRYPLRHVSIMNHKRILGMSCGVWILAGFMTLLSVLPFPEPQDDPALDRFSCKLNNQLGHVLIATIAILYIPCLLMVILYGRIFVIASNHLKSSDKRSRKDTTTTVTSSETSGNTTWYGYWRAWRQKNPSSSTNGETDTSFSSAESVFSSGSSSFSAENRPTPSNENHVTKSNSTIFIPVDQINRRNSNMALSAMQKKQITLSVRLALLVGLLLFSYVPFFTAFLLRGIYSSYSPPIVSDTVFMTLGWIRYSNSCINPIVYALTVPGYKKVLKKIVGFQ